MSLKNILITIVISAAVSILTVYLYDKHRTVKIATLDLSENLIELKKAFMSNEITQEELEAKLKEIQHKIDEIPERYVVLREDVVIKNAEKLKLNEEKETKNVRENSKQ